MANQPRGDKEDNLNECQPAALIFSFSFFSLREAAIAFFFSMSRVPGDEVALLRAEGAVLAGGLSDNEPVVVEAFLPAAFVFLGAFAIVEDDQKSINMTPQLCSASHKDTDGKNN
jgi:hypothetical protein